MRPSPFRVLCVIALAIVGSGGPSAEAAVVDPDLRIVIRTYDGSDSAGDLTPAFASAAAILEEAGIAVSWIRCDAVFVRRDDNPCLAPLAANELAIRFVRLPPHLAEHHLVTLGDSLVDTRAGAGALATIYVNRVSSLARRCSLDDRMLLGRAIAHEVGHLLLGTAGHAEAGLMRAAWTQQALRRDDPHDWVFAPGEADRMRNAVRNRAARRLAAGKIGE